MVVTPRLIIDSVVRSVCDCDVERLVPLAGAGMNETYRAELVGGVAVVVRIARQPGPWFVDEAHLMTQARGVGVPTAEVLGLEQLEHDGQLLRSRSSSSCRAVRSTSCWGSCRPLISSGWCWTLVSCWRGSTA